MSEECKDQLLKSLTHLNKVYSEKGEIEKVKEVTLENCPIELFCKPTAPRLKSFAHCRMFATKDVPRSSPFSMPKLKGNVEEAKDIIANNKRDNLISLAFKCRIQSKLMTV